jgi:hypothetical protein
VPHTRDVETTGPVRTSRTSPPTCETSTPTRTPPNTPTGRARPACRWAGQPRKPILDLQTQLITHAVRIAAVNTATSLARAIRVPTGWARVRQEAHALVRQALIGSGGLGTRAGVRTVRLDTLPTRRATTAIAERCGPHRLEDALPRHDIVRRAEVKPRS